MYYYDRYYDRGYRRSPPPRPKRYEVIKSLNVNVEVLRLIAVKRHAYMLETCLTHSENQMVLIVNESKKCLKNVEDWSV
jgi:hypothetical protein